MKKFENELAELESRLAEMSELAKKMVHLVANAIKDRGFDAHEEIAACEERLDQMQTDIDKDSIRMLTVYSPVATDLRYLLVCTHVTAQLERIGDQVVNLCEDLNLMTTEPSEHGTLSKIQKMADLVCEIVTDALDSYFTRDASKAATTRSRDDLVDSLNDQVIKDLLTDNVLRDVLSGASDIADAVAQILMARHLERIADQAVNICKEVVYAVAGEDVRHIPSEEQANDD